MSEEDLFDEIYFEDPTTPMEAVSLVNFTLSTLEMIDIEDQNLTVSGKSAITKIKNQSLKLLSWAVQDMHDSIFEEETHE